MKHVVAFCWTFPLVLSLFFSEYHIPSNCKCVQKAAAMMCSLLYETPHIYKSCWVECMLRLPHSRLLKRRLKGGEGSITFHKEGEELLVVLMHDLFFPDASFSPHSAAVFVPSRRRSSFLFFSAKSSKVQAQPICYSIKTYIIARKKIEGSKHRVLRSCSHD
jgi:hypothetical protein